MRPWSVFLQVPAFWCAFLLVGVQGCARSAAPSCLALSPELRGTLQSPLLRWPVTLLVDSTFTVHDQIAIEKAARAWNGWRGQTFFKTEIRSVSEAVRNLDLRQSQWGNLDATNDSFFVVNEREPARLRSRAWAMTRRELNTDAEGVATLHQIILVRTAVIPPEQVSSFVMHELGHALGLDHIPNGLAADSVMRAKFRESEIRESVGEDDLSRLACLYPDDRMN